MIFEIQEIIDGYVVNEEKLTFQVIEGTINLTSIGSTAQNVAIAPVPGLGAGNAQDAFVELKSFDRSIDDLPSFVLLFENQLV